jgi:hypothetical protein
MMYKSFASILALLCVANNAVVNGFAPVTPATTSGIKRSTSSSSSLEMWNKETMKGAATSLVAAALLIGSSVDPAFAMPTIMDGSSPTTTSDFGSSQVLIAARSGGRAGGRSSAARAPASRRAPTTTNTRVIERTTYVAPPIYSSPMYVAPLYNPLPGLGFSMGLNAINQVGNDMRDYRQEGEIQNTRAQLEQSKMREAEMEARLRQLEMAQGQPTMSQQQFQQLMLMQQQQQAAALAK